VCNPYRVKTICIAAFSIMDNPTLLLLLLDSVTHIFYLPLVMTSCLGQLRCEERESHTDLEVLEGVCWTGSPGCRNGPSSEFGR
jgi:hypothetical protein